MADRVTGACWLVLMLAATSCVGPRPESAAAPALPPVSERRDDKALPAVLTLEDALEYAWHRHPAMDEAQRIIESTHGKRVQAGLWPRPVLKASVLDKPTESETGLTLSQTLELGGKRGARIAEADAALFLANAGLVERWANIKADIKEAFARLAYSRTVAELAAETARADTQLADIAGTLAAAGKLAEREAVVTRRAAAVSQSRAKAEAARLADAGRRVLAAVGTDPASCEVTIRCDLPEPQAPPGFEALLSKALTDAPAMHIAKAKTTLAQARRHTATAARWMDLRIEGTVKDISADSDEEDKSGSAAGGGLALDLPLWNRGQGDAAAAAKRVEAARDAERAVALDVASAVSRLLAEHDAWSDRCRTYVDRVVPLAEQHFVLSRSAFENGKLSSSDLLKSERARLAVLTEQAQARLMLALSAIQLQRITEALTLAP